MSEKSRVLDMLEKQIISADECIKLLEALGETANKGEQNEKERMLDMLETEKITGKQCAQMIKAHGTGVEDGKQALKYLKEPSNVVLRDGSVYTIHPLGSTRFEDEDNAEEYEKELSYSISLNLASMEVVVDSEGDELSYEFIDEDTGEVIEKPDFCNIEHTDKRLRISEDFFKSIGPKMADGVIGKKVIETFGLTVMSRANYTLYLHIPNNKKINKAKFETKMSNISVNGISNIEILKLNTISGKINAENIVADAFTTSSVSGHTKLKNIVANKINISNVSGLLEYNGKTPTLKLDTVSGRVVVENDMLLYNSSISTVSGNVECYVRDEEHQNYSASGILKQNKLQGRTNGVEGTSLKFSTVSGSVKLCDLA